MYIYVIYIYIYIYIHIYIYIDILLDFIAVFEIFIMKLFDIRLAMTTFHFVRIPAFMLKYKLPYALKIYSVDVHK